MQHKPIETAAMIQVQTKYKAWGLSLSALMTAAVAFPVIAETAAEQREANLWAQKATEIETVSVDHKDSALVARLASLQSDPSLTSYMRDASLTEPLITYKRADLEGAIEASEEMRCLSEAVYYEARSETRSGQKAVAEVILNRVASKHFPDTVCGVVYEGSERRTGCQFSFTCDGSMSEAPKGKSWKRSKAVAELVLTGGVEPFTNRATHYHTTAVNPHWSGTLRMTKRVGSHVFYRFAPRNYTPSTPSIMVAPPS